MEKRVTKSRSYQDLQAWKAAIELVKEIYKVTARFPPSEFYGLTGQIRRVAVSIPSNIAEGQGRNSSRGFKQFLSIALGSLAELETQSIIAQEIEHLESDKVKSFRAMLDNVRKMTRGLASRLSLKTENCKLKTGSIRCKRSLTGS
jgi:four helix bundle protein